MEEKVMKVCHKCGRELPIDAFNKCAKKQRRTSTSLP